MEVDSSEGVHDCVVEKLQNFAFSESNYCQLSYISVGLIPPDVVSVLTEEDVHDSGDQHVDQDENDEGVELAGTPV